MLVRLTRWTAPLLSVCGCGFLVGGAYDGDHNLIELSWLFHGAAALSLCVPALVVTFSALGLSMQPQKSSSYNFVIASTMVTSLLSAVAAMKAIEPASLLLAIWIFASAYTLLLYAQPSAGYNLRLNRHWIGSDGQRDFYAIRRGTELTLEHRTGRSQSTTE